MTQAVFPDIDANTKSGTELATDLNDFKASLLTQHSGTSFPTYAETGTEWLDSATTGFLIKKIFDGSQWVTINSLDTAAHTISYGGNNPTAAFTISRTDTSADLLELYRNNQTEGTGAVILTQRNDADVKKTMAKVVMESNSLTNGAEDAQVSFEAMKAGTLTEIFRVNNSEMFVDFLQGTGTRRLVTDANGIVSSEAVEAKDDLITNGFSDTADTSAYTVDTLTFSKSTTSTELIDASSVFKAVSSAGAESLTSETVTLSNGHIEHQMIVSLKYKCSADWTVQILDQSDTVLAQETLNAFTPVSNEAYVKKMFTIVPNLTTTLKVKFISTAADTLLFDNLQMKSTLAVDEPLYFERDLTNNVSNTDLFDLTRLKSKAYKIECQITRETDTNYAQAIAEFFVSYDSNTTTWRVAKETVTDLESVDTDVSFNMNGTTLRYTTSDISGTNYSGKINGTIKRIL